MRHHVTDRAGRVQTSFHKCVRRVPADGAYRAVSPSFGYFSVAASGTVSGAFPGALAFISVAASASLSVSFS